MTLEIVKEYLFNKYRGRSLILCPKSYITSFLVSIHNYEILIHVIFFFFFFYQHVILKYQVKIIKSLCASNAFNVAFLTNLYTMYFLSWRFIFHRYRYGVSRVFLRFVSFIPSCARARNGDVLNREDFRLDALNWTVRVLPLLALTRVHSDLWIRDFDENVFK